MSRVYNPASDVELTHAGSRLAGGLPPQSRIPSCWRSPRRSCRTRGWTSARPGARRPASSLSRQVLTTMVRVIDICLTHFIPVTTTPTTIMTHTIDHCIHLSLNCPSCSLCSSFSSSYIIIYYDIYRCIHCHYRRSALPWGPSWSMLLSERRWCKLNIFSDSH